LLKCIYCRFDKLEIDFSLEHVIPQSLGGAYAPDVFKTRHVCKKCNSNLGLFVDASFEKSWFVSQQLYQNARLFFDPQTSPPLPLLCMGESKIKLPYVTENEVIELWFGPFGEQVYWIRSKDEALFWYSGGNPRTAKERPSRAYFMLCVNSKKDYETVFKSFQNAFPSGKVKKLMCTQVEGTDLEEWGFSKPDEIDNARVAAIKKPQDSPDLNLSLSFNTEYDIRFLSKLGIGLSFALLGETSLGGAYAEELNRALWMKPDDNVPLLNGHRALTSNYPYECNPSMMNVKGGVCFVVTAVGRDIAMNLALGPRLNWTLKIAEIQGERVPFENFALILFRTVRKSVRLPLIDFVAHQSGSRKNATLEEIEQQLSMSDDYFKELDDRGKLGGH
jgi:HNH endonuclease